MRMISVVILAVAGQALTPQGESWQLPVQLAACSYGDMAMNNCLSDLASIGLGMFGNTREVVRTCSDENPILGLLGNPEQLPEGRNRELLMNRRLGVSQHAMLNLNILEQTFPSLSEHGERIWELAVGYAHVCLVRGSCEGQDEAGLALRAAHKIFLASSSSLIQSALGIIGAAQLPWAAGIGEPASLIGRHAFDARHLDFTQAVLNALGGLEPIQAVGLLHDLALRIATSNCELQAELLAHATLAEMLAPDVIAKMTVQKLPRLEFHHGYCCRRYHVLNALLGPLVTKRQSESQGPFRILEVGVNNALTSEYLLTRLEEVEFDGVDPYIDADAIYEEAVGRLQRFGPRAKLWRKTSESAAPMFEQGTFDFIFIDGDHSRKGVTTDLKLWRDKVRPGGVLAGHDLFNPAFEGVLEALLEDLDSVQSGAARETVHYAADFVWWLHL